ncbi:discoidin domain-containing protein [Paenibacillus solanacearum]|uniref:discoidin domain-containing protein n=1 Tax=Paenibacillus solanacearum TaxID=2048548 RepID=UPI001C402EDF|nr:discoidin domain-containing protein [Paenibacillus solanacearum]
MNSELERMVGAASNTANGQSASGDPLPVNLALGQPVSKSSDIAIARAEMTVDGEPETYWQPHSTDRADDGMVWLSVDLGSAHLVDEVAYQVRTGNVFSSKALYSSDGMNWQDAVTKTVNANLSGKTETIHFAAVSTRYIKLEIYLPNSLFQMNELSVAYTNWTPPPSVLSSVYITNAAGGKAGFYDTVTLSKGDAHPLRLGGVMTSGEPADLGAAVTEWVSSAPLVAAVQPSGNVTALREGVAKITGRATLNQVSKEASVWFDVYDPGILLVETSLEHPTLRQDIGYPALLQIGGLYPSIRMLPHKAGQAEASIVNLDTGAAVTQLLTASLQPGMEQMLTFPGTISSNGQYKIVIELQLGDKTVYDAFYFTVHDTAAIGTNQSQIAYQRQDGTMAYVPDYKGNRIIDFSGAGYMGGGVKLPDVQARIALEPQTGSGDDTARIQAAIDEVSAMPLNAEGFRGAVLLKKGTYRLGGTLTIRSSGVVLRGEGQDENGTILYATGASRRNMLEIGGTALQLLTGTASAVSDLYVPSGAKVIRVENASAFQPGDSVKIQRSGNSRWIHEIDMDTIYDELVETTQWTPFSIDFDRIVTQVNGNEITLDAPIANSIERKWGGGQIVKYADPGRIEQVGVENMRVDTEFNRNVTSTITYEGQTLTYYADENHAVSFAIFNHVKNAWMREITGFHLEHALAHANRGSKWITVQDSQSLDMVSLLVGARRYPFKMTGELALMQRNYSETARHAFVVDNRVPGPNVFLDSESQIDFLPSEPHHRWSVGGLYDNVNGKIHIRDRGWNGGGHGWSGANYVTWNTVGELSSQQPPTAQNYAIGHVGQKVGGFLPNFYDQRPREDAYWDHLNSHVTPRSLYHQQLEERLDMQAVQNTFRSPVGGGSLDVPVVP